MSRTTMEPARSRKSSRVDVDQEGDCRFWAERLGVYPGELKEAVVAVGNDVDDLWRYIDERKHEPPGARRARGRQAPDPYEHDDN